MNERPSISRIVTTDYIAFVGFLVPIVSAVMLVILVLLRSENTTSFAWIALIAAFGVLVWRIRLITSVFENGITAPGTISGIYFYRDRGRVEYIFTYGGQKLSSSNAIHKTKQTEAIQPGAQVTVVVDRNNPKRAFIRQLYLHH